MKKRFTLYILLLTAVLPAACSAAPGKSFFWKISFHGKTAHILGSIHLATKDIYPLHPKIERAFKQARCLVLETTDRQDSTFVKLMLKHAMYPAGQSLRKNLSPSAYKALARKIKKLGQNIKTYNKFKPWFLAVALSIITLQRAGYSPELGIDFHFENKAKKLGKKITGLDSNTRYVKLFAFLNRSIQEVFLNYMIQNIDQSVREADRMIHAWKTGNTKMLASIFERTFKKYPRTRKLKKLLLDDRNIDWARKILPMLRSGKKLFIVVGAGHLVGKGNLLELLQKAGCRIHQR